MDPLTAIMLMGLIVIMGLIGELVFKSLKIPSVLLLLILGLLIGPIMHWADPVQFASFAPIIAPIALMLLLFDGGLRMRIYKFIHESPRAVTLGFLSIIFCIIASALLMHYVFGWDLYLGAILGAIVGGSSSAIVIPVTQRLERNKGELTDILTLESVVTDVLCIVIAIALIQALVTGGETLAIERLILSTFSIGVFLGIVVGILWLKILSIFKDMPYSHVVTIGVIFLLYPFTEFFGGSGAIAALLFGLVLGNSDEIASMLRIKGVEINEASLRKFQSEISFFVKAFFFVYLGLIVTISNISIILIGLALTVALFIARFIAVNFATIGSKLAKRKDLMTAIAPRGLAAAVLSQIPLAYGLQYGRELSDLTFIIIITSVIICTVGVLIHERMRQEKEEKGKRKR